MSENRQIQTTCCIAGGGPAGMMLGFLLARAGVDVIVLEKHADFLRDFRGDTIHPSTLEVIYELGLLEEFLKRPHQEIREFAGQIGDELIPLADLTHLPTHCKFLGFMPQWDFLDFLADEARSYPAFKLMMNAEVTDLLEAGNKIVGVKVSTPEGDLEIRAELTVGCDGRKSIVREQAGLLVESLGAPIDVLWFRLSRKPGDPGQVLGRFVTAKIMVMLNREDYWQCAFVIPKGAAEEIKRRGLEAFRADIVAIAPFLKDRVAELQDWDQVKLLTVLVDRLRKWYRPGLLCIGDAAHAMSPVGGVGINLAIQDAVATANILAGPLSVGYVSVNHLQKVQWRREFPTKVTQWGQVQVQERILKPVLGSRGQVRVPWFLRLFKMFPLLRRIPARLIGIGVRPEHVRTPDMNPQISQIKK
ncbi:MAG TPA: FAD-dependent oxidoreductase [Pyrinomonadaceae bacterium]|nr:FAD-dependent oxidoreductase [Pyrinomonadaceae bacterium]